MSLANSIQSNSAELWSGKITSSAIRHLPAAEKAFGSRGMILPIAHLNLWRIHHVG